MLASTLGQRLRPTHTRLLSLTLPTDRSGFRIILTPYEFSSVRSITVMSDTVLLTLSGKGLCTSRESCRVPVPRLFGSLAFLDVRVGTWGRVFFPFPSFFLYVRCRPVPSRCTPDPTLRISSCHGSSVAGVVCDDGGWVGFSQSWPKRRCFSNGNEVEDRLASHRYCPAPPACNTDGRHFHMPARVA